MPRSNTCKAVGAAAAVLFIVAAASVFVVRTAGPNEWMLVVSDGTMVRAGVGITHWRKLNEQVATFPATLNKVPFRAQQVTKEKQGVEVSGFAMWVVHREGTGPFKAYKHLGGLTEEGLAEARANLKDMAESIIRSRVSQLSIDEVIANREAIRDAVRGSMQAVVNGWGVWLETVEVTDVRVLSNSLFTNLQTEFREATRQASEAAKLLAQKAIDEVRVASDLATSKAEIEATADAEVHRAQHELAAAEQQEELKKAQDALQLAALRRAFELEKQRLEYEERHRELEHTFALASLAREQEKEQRRAEHDQAMAKDAQTAALYLDARRAESERDQMAKRLAVERDMTEANMRVAAMDTLKDVYGSLPVRSVDVRNIVTGGGGREAGGFRLGSLLPGLSALVEGVAGATGPAGPPAAAPARASPPSSRNPDI